jgi:hypothetical protein
MRVAERAIATPAGRALRIKRRRLYRRLGSDCQGIGIERSEKRRLIARHCSRIVKDPDYLSIGF